jgi:hypothetical protein
MTKRTRDLAKRGTGGLTGGSGQVIRLAGPVAPRSGSLVRRVVPAHLACRIGARAQAGAVAAAGSLTLLSRAGAAISSQPAGSVDLARERGPEPPDRRQTRAIEQETAHNEHAEVHCHTEAFTTGRNCHA